MNKWQFKNKMRKPKIWFENRHPLIKIIIVAVLIVFSSIQLGTLYASAIDGDPYLFPSGFFVKNDLENEPQFINYSSN